MTNLPLSTALLCIHVLLQNTDSNTHITFVISENLKEILLGQLLTDLQTFFFWWYKVTAELMKVYRCHLCYHLLFILIQPAEKKKKKSVFKPLQTVYNHSWHLWLLLAFIRITQCMGCLWIMLPVLFHVICKPSWGYWAIAGIDAANFPKPGKRPKKGEKLSGAL